MEQTNTGHQMETDQLSHKCPRCPKTFESSTLQVFFSEIVIEDLLQQGNNNVIESKKNYFKKLFNAMLNCVEGNVVVFHVPDTRVLDKHDIAWNDQLMQFVPDNACYHDVFERVIIDTQHFRVRVKPRKDSDCTMSTFRFHSSLSRDKGLDNHPSHHNMQRVLENARDGHGFCSGMHLNMPNDSDFQLQQEVRVRGDPDGAVPFQESMWLQAKKIAQQLSPWKVVKIMWEETHELGKYISAFSKVPRGGIIYFGISEKHDKSNKKVKVKRFVSEGVYLEEHNICILKQQLKEKMENLLWVRVPPESSGDASGNNPVSAGKVEVIPLPDECPSGDAYGNSPVSVGKVDVLPLPERTKPLYRHIIKITVHQFKGVCFFRKEGPESYVLNERDEPVPVEDWSDWAEGSHCQDFQPVTVHFDGLDM